MPRKETQSRRTRRRIAPDKVRKTAVRQGGFSMLDLPAHIKEWAPDKEGWFVGRLVPFTVEGFNPDDIEKGIDWYRLRYGVHKRIAGGTVDAVCPRSVGKRCTICDEADKLSENYDANKELIKTLRPTKMMVCFMILPAESEDEVIAFNWNMSKFGELLDTEIKMAEEEHLSFYWDEDGWVLKFRVVEAEYMGRKYLTTDKIDFKDAKHLATLSDEILEKVKDPANFLIVKSDKELEALFLGLDEEDIKTEPPPFKTGAEEDEKPAPKSKTSKAKPAGNPKPEPEPEPEPEDDGGWGDEDDGGLGPQDPPNDDPEDLETASEDDDDDDW